MKAYFLSDIHIKNPNDPSARALEKFLRGLLPEAEGAKERTEVFLVGDIFDLWIGDHEYFRKRFESIVDAVRALVRKGIVVHFFEGNHDLHLEEFWGSEIGVRVHPDAEYFEIDGKIVRVEHGDLINPNDRGYLFLRAFLRTGIMRVLAMKLPAKVVAGIGERASRASRQYTSDSARKAISESECRELIRRHTKLCYAEKPFDLMITGHVHVVDDHVFEIDGRSVRSVNLGSWFDRHRVFIIDGARLEFIEL